MLLGLRATAYPLQALIPDRRYDVGVEIGGGYALVGGPAYDMDGTYFTLGATGEYRINPWLSAGVFYRLFTPFLTKFFVDYATNRTEAVKGFTAYWHTFGVGATVHFQLVR